MKKKRILIIEDNPMNLELITDLLEAFDFDVSTALTAEDGLNQIAKETPDLILMDIALPNMDGLQALKILKTDPVTRPIPVIALTAHAMESDRTNAMEAGAAAYITKPIQIHSFTEKIQSLLGESLP